MVTYTAPYPHHDTHAELERCAQACHECEDVCLAMVPHCLARGGEHADPAHINLLLDCIAICAASYNLLNRNSFMHIATCRACAEICEACGRDCEQLGDDPQMLLCAETCFRCADSCTRAARM